VVNGSQCRCSPPSMKTRPSARRRGAADVTAPATRGVVMMVARNHDDGQRRGRNALDSVDRLGAATCWPATSGATVIEKLPLLPTVPVQR